MGEAAPLRPQVGRTFGPTPRTIASAVLTLARACADAILAVLVAPTCAGCHQPLDTPTRSAVCARCWTSIAPIPPPFCESCGEPIPSWRVISAVEQRCARCRRRRGAVAKSRTAGAYEGTLRHLLHALKYDRRRSLAGPLAERMREHGSEILFGADIVVPVPLHRWRRYRRGFNQAEDLARYLPLPVVLALRRRRATVSQTDLPAARRHANVRNAFALRRGVSVRGLRVVLIDDVSTTGATLDACARVLLEAGAVEVRALTAARAIVKRART